MSILPIRATPSFQHAFCSRVSWRSDVAPRLVIARAQQRCSSHLLLPKDHQASMQYFRCKQCTRNGRELSTLCVREHKELMRTVNRGEVFATSLIGEIVLCSRTQSTAMESEECCWQRWS